MEYNSERPSLYMPEHGRNIQKMIDYALSIDDREERNKIARVIVDVMGQLNPHLRDFDDFKHKLWDHLFIISNWKLDVDSPYPKPSPDEVFVKPEPLKYPAQKIKFKHYGKNLENIMDKLKDLPEGQDKDELVKHIANFMKKLFLSWNREAVEDEVIFRDLVTMSGGQLKPAEATTLSATNLLLSQRPATNTRLKMNNNKKNNSHSGRNNKNQKRRPR